MGWMGWIWADDNEEPSLSKNSVKLSNPNPNSRNSIWNQYPTKKVVTSSCKTEEVGHGKFVRRCVRTEQILRDCVGRRPEVVQSKTYRTEDDVTNQVFLGEHPFQSSSPYIFPSHLRNVEFIEQIGRGGSDGMKDSAPYSDQSTKVTGV